jgi:hypothetical protein
LGLQNAIQEYEERIYLGFDLFQVLACDLTLLLGAGMMYATMAVASEYLVGHLKDVN